MKLKVRFFLPVLLLFSLLLLCACQPSAAPAPAPADPQTAAPTPVAPTPPSPTPETPEPPPPTAAVSPAPEVSAPAVSQLPAPSEEVRGEQLDAFFDGAVFVGDSIMEGIRQYVAASRTETPTLGGAQFLTSTMGVSVTRLLYEEQYGPYFRYKGVNQPLLEILDQMDCTRIFLLLGLNDLGRGELSVERIAADYSLLIDTLQAAAPKAEVVVLACPPKVASTWLPDYISNRNYGNPLILEFVDAVRAMCQTRGTAFVDIHTLLRNEKGALPDEYCRDGFVHLNSAGSKLVVEELYRFAAQRITEETV